MQRRLKHSMPGLWGGKESKLCKLKRILKRWLIIYRYDISYLCWLNQIWRVWDHSGCCFIAFGSFNWNHSSFATNQCERNMIDQMYHIFCDVLFLHAGKVAGPLSQSILSQIKGIHVTTWIHLASTGPDPSSSMFWSLCDVFAMVILCSVAGIRKSSLIRSCHLVPAFGRLRNREWLGDSKSTS
jgi:hypothetical protein